MVALTHNIAKKQHRERAQPTERRKWGLLEKKKDYKLRSQDFHKKENHLKLLRRKATERNPDEFYHSMVNKKTDNRGILITERGNEVLSNGAAQLLKTQDSSYVRTLTSGEIRKIEKLETELTFGGQGEHTVFVDSDSQAKSFDAAEYFGTHKSLLNRRENRLRKNQLEEQDLSKTTLIPTDVDERTEQKLRKQKMAKYKELDQRLERQQQLSQVQQQMDLQRELMKKGDKKKIITKDGKQTWKWKNVRKR
ncbi:Utp11p [Sugiyamaella lignohabitans]|uniref:U3 small nucleolar RNA-associated protein 11 n=1 Tax=Sugiyamaella lignohabitans TaxID=796027 RepID=A0A167EDR2_9ASCO|nr:Utp11p [Sugiyamaella lignohabitans]ANB13944.1 Utp11p [Sugiyamaella lignohabitans]